MFKVMRSLEDVKGFDEGVVEEVKKFVRDDEFRLLYNSDVEDYVIWVREKGYWMIGGYEEFKFIEMSEKEIVEFWSKGL